MTLTGNNEQNTNGWTKPRCAGDPALSSRITCVDCLPHVSLPAHDIQIVQGGSATGANDHILSSKITVEQWRLQILEVFESFPALQKHLSSACFVTYFGNGVPLRVVLPFSTGCGKLDPLPLLSSDCLPFCSAIFNVKFLHLKQKWFGCLTVLEQFYLERTFISYCKVHLKETVILNLKNRERFHELQLWIHRAWLPLAATPFGIILVPIIWF